MKKIIILVIFISLAIFSGYQLGVDQAFNQYPAILTGVNPPFEPTITTSGRFEGEKVVSLEGFDTDNEQQYLYLDLNVNCSDIEIYALDENQSSENTDPYDIIPAQNVECTQQGAISTYDQLVPNQHLELHSDTPITGAYYTAIEGDSNE